MSDHSILVIDEGTTSTRVMLFDPHGESGASEQKDIHQSYPAPGMVEHDAEEIWESSLACARAVVEKSGGADRLRGLGITNQRETIVFWNARTGKALGPAIVWQDRRTAGLCRSMQERGHEDMVSRSTGLLLDPYFSASKIAWALENWPQLREAGRDLKVGTIESWLVWKLTGGLHVTDATNASRTALMNIERGEWDENLLDLWDIDRSILPEIVDCAGKIGETESEMFGRPIAITGMAGDQQAASIGQACFGPGDTKATYGTGAFILTNTGQTVQRSQHRLLSTVAWQLDGNRQYALEGSVFVAGSLVQWLRDHLGLIRTAEETEVLARSVEDHGGVYLVPALSGLGAPYWQPDARALITGLSFSANKAHIARAALEAMSYQTHDLMRAFAADGAVWQGLRIDGGMVANDWMAQDLADMLDLTVERPGLVETTALGAAMLTALGAGIFKTLDEAECMRSQVVRFEPKLESAARNERLVGWRKAVACALDGF